MKPKPKGPRYRNLTARAGAIDYHRGGIGGCWRSGCRATSRPRSRPLVTPECNTVPDRRELEERARKELRSLSGYVAKLIVEDLAADR